jgi:hypothetical protein
MHGSSSHRFCGVANSQGSSNFLAHSVVFSHGIVWLKGELYATNIPGLWDRWVMRKRTSSTQNISTICRRGTYNWKIILFISSLMFVLQLQGMWVSNLFSCNGFGPHKDYCRFRSPSAIALPDLINVHQVGDTVKILVACLVYLLLLWLNTRIFDKWPGLGYYSCCRKPASPYTHGQRNANALPSWRNCSSRQCTTR